MRNPAPRYETLEFTGTLFRETDNASQLARDGPGTKLNWVPKSQVEDNGDGTFAMPEWLAKEKGFI